MRTMKFQVNDTSASGTLYPAVWVTVSEMPGGMLDFQVQVAPGITGDLRGLFFDVANEALIGSLQVSNASSGLTEVRLGNDSIKDLGDGSNMNGLLGSDGGYDVGIEIGSSGIGKDDYQSFHFNLSSTSSPLSLADLAQVDFGVRLTSVGEYGSSRSLSAKLLETTFTPITAVDDDVVVAENNQIHSNILDNDRSGLAIDDQVSVIGWSGGVLGQAVLLNNAGGATLQVNADGSYVLDSTQADTLSEGESLHYSFSYQVRNQNETTAWATDSAVLTVVVNGVNDGPVASDDDFGRLQAGEGISGNVLENDHDVDRLDVIKVVSVDGQALGAPITLGSGAILTMGEDGSFRYETNGAFSHLNAGETATDVFEYQIADGHGGYDTAQVQFVIDGVGTGLPPEPKDDPVVPQFPTMIQNISNVVLYLDDGNRETEILKVKLQPEGLQLKDVDLLNISGFITGHGETVGANTHLVGISIHAGQEYPNLALEDRTAPGEGAFYFIGDDTPIEAVGSRVGNSWVSDWTNDDIPLSQDALDVGLNYELLATQANIVFNNFDPNSGLWFA